MKEGTWKLREQLRDSIIAHIDQWREGHPDSGFITDLEVTKILDTVSTEYVHRHHRRREKRGKNEHGEYL